MTHPSHAQGRDVVGETSSRRTSLAPGLLFGIGLGGFVDGILLHQVLQWHHMVSADGDHPVTTVAGLEANTLADGFFHVVTWLVVLAASVVTVHLWRRGDLAPRWSGHLGALLAGWGLFNLVEGLVVHQLLGLHHVRDDLGGPLAWDLGFLGLGLVLVAVGTWLAQRGARAPGS
jgi:uncharacterized membrane protein